MALFYRYFGEGEPVIILHGLFGSSDNWITIGKELAENHEVFIPDQRNHGQSFHSDDFNYDLMVEDLCLFMDNNSITNPYIIGHSMGGKVAMHFALSHPGELRKLVVIDIAPKYYPIHHNEVLKGLNKLHPETIISRPDADRRLAQYVQAHRTRHFLLKNITRNRESGGYKWKLNLSSITENIEHLGQGFNPYAIFNGPTLFISGEKSDYITEGDIPQIKNIFPNSKVVTIENAGHWVHAEQPDRLISSLKYFINADE